MGNIVRDMQGNEWESFRNQFDQRQLRCIAGDRLGEVIHDSRLGEDVGAGISTKDNTMKPARDMWRESIDAPSFWE